MKVPNINEEQRFFEMDDSVVITDEDINRPRTREEWDSLEHTMKEFGLVDEDYDIYRDSDCKILE